MYLKKYLLLGGLLVCLLTFSFGTGWSARQLQTENVHLRGSSSVAPIAQKIAIDYMQENSEIAVTVTPVGTMRGIKSLIDATCNIAMASADSDEEQEKHAKDNEITLIKHVIAYDALIPIVNTSNSITNLTVDDLRKLFSGEITNWEQLGGSNQPVVVVSYDGSSGNYETWKDKVMKEGKVITPNAKIMATNDMKKFIQQTPGAIGYVALPNIDSTIKALTVDSVAAEVNNIKNNQYPIVRELSLLTTKDSTASVNKFVDYFLSDKVQQYVGKSGVIPVK